MPFNQEVESWGDLEELYIPPVGTPKQIEYAKEIPAFPIFRRLSRPILTIPVIQTASLPSMGSMVTPSTHGDTSPKAARDLRHCGFEISYRGSSQMLTS
jgi:hypothetical protein